ncbi:MAG: hypothetical protein V4772_03995 [Pseudomonadota bacterium]
MPMTEKQLLERDAKRDIGAELLLSVQQMVAAKTSVVARIYVPTVTTARLAHLYDGLFIEVDPKRGGKEFLGN